MMSGESLTAFNFEKLGDSNFQEWKFSMQMYLTAKSLWEIVTGDEVADEEASDEDKLKYKKRHNLALSAIGLGVRTDLQIYVRNCTTAKEAWDSLASRFQKKGLVKRIELRQTLYGTRLNLGGDMIAHVNTIKSISEQLAAVDDPVSENDLSMILIASWPREYYNLITNLEIVDEDKLSWTYVRDRAIAEYERRSLGHEVPRDDGALNTTFKEGKDVSSKFRGRGRGRGQGRRKETRSCHHCKEKGHLQRYCPKLKKENNDEASVAVGIGRLDDEFALSTEDADDHDGFGDDIQALDDPGVADTGNNNDDSTVIEMSESQILSPELINTGQSLDNTELSENLITDELYDDSDREDIRDDVEFALHVSPNGDKQTLERTPCARDHHWTLDSGCTRHMTPLKSEFTSYVEFVKPIPVTLADKSQIYGYGIGNVMIKLFDGSTFVPVEIKNVMYVPKLHRKLLSISDITDRGSTVTFAGRSSTVTFKGKTFLFGQRHGKLWLLYCEDEECFANFVGEVQTNTSPKELWHQRYAHLSSTYLNMLQSRSMVDGLSFTHDNESSICEGCIYGKQHRWPFPKASKRITTSPLELIHSDVCGPISIPTIGGSRYFVTFIDNFSRYTVAYMMKRKDEAIDKFKEYVAMAETKFNRKVVTVRTDNGGEYCSNDFDEFLRKRGTQEERTIPYTSQQNGLAERMNRTLMDKVRAMLYHSNLPLRFWGEALSTAVYLTNRSPTSTLNETPYERWNGGSKPDVSNLRVWGCNAYMHVPDQKRKKLDRKSTKCIFVGYPEGKKGYKLFELSTGKMRSSRDVIFVENAFDQSVDKGDEPTELLPSSFFENFGDEEDDEDDRVTNERDDAERNEDIGNDNQDNRNDDRNDDDSGEDVQAQPEEATRPRRNTRAPDFYGDVVSHRFGQWEEQVNAAICDDPTSYREAMASPNSQNWKSATDAEMDSLIKNGTWELTDLPAGKSVIGSKWVFKTKINPDGTFSKFKSRLVAQGFSQRQGIDYNEVFAPVVKHESLRTFFAIANQYDLEVHQMDVNSAYLNGDIDAEVYMKQPEGYVDPNHPNKVCKLRKGLYGLKQGARCWNKKIDKFLKSEGFVASDADPCIYVKRKKGKICILALYVDDTVIATNCKRMLADIKGKLCGQFHMEDLGEVKYILGMMVKRDREAGTLTIDQRCYLEGVLQRFGMENCNPVSTPLEPGRQLRKATEDDEEVDTHRYQEIVGCLIYASITTRPDISHAVNVLSQHMAKPNKEHLSAAKRVLRYLRGTTDVGIIFRKSDNFELVGYSDADWAGDVDSRKSTSGYVFLLGGNIISWASKKQPVVALSTTEAEYIALCLATQEAIWLRRLCASVGQAQTKPTKILEDNQGTISMSRNPRNNSRTKHIDIKYHFVREAVEKNETDIVHCSTQKMVADTLTKGLTKPAFEIHRNSMNSGRI